MWLKFFNMAAKKLASEIEKHLRKVDEGVQSYDELWQELYDYNVRSKGTVQLALDCSKS